MKRKRFSMVHAVHTKKRVTLFGNSHTTETIVLALVIGCIYHALRLSMVVIASSRGVSIRKVQP